MKTRIKFFSIISALAMVVFILFSCAKEELLPVTASNEFIAQSAKDISSETALVSIGSANEFLNMQIDGTDLTFAEAFKKIDPNPHPNWGVAINSSICIRSGVTLIVYNPYNPNLYFYDTDRFSIYWFKDGQPLRDKDIQLECICKGKYAVVVLNDATKQGIGIAYFTVGASCYTHEVALPNDNSDF